MTRLGRFFELHESFICAGGIEVRDYSIFCDIIICDITLNKPENDDEDSFHLASGENKDIR